MPLQETQLFFLSDFDRKSPQVRAVVPATQWAELVSEGTHPLVQAYKENRLRADNTDLATFEYDEVTALNTRVNIPFTKLDRIVGVVYEDLFMVVN